MKNLVFFSILFLVSLVSNAQNKLKSSIEVSMYSSTYKFDKLSENLNLCFSGHYLLERKLGKKTSFGFGVGYGNYKYDERSFVVICYIPPFGNSFPVEGKRETHSLEVPVYTKFDLGKKERIWIKSQCQIVLPLFYTVESAYNEYNRYIGSGSDIQNINYKADLSFGSDFALAGQNCYVALSSYLFLNGKLESGFDGFISRDIAETMRYYGFGLSLGVQI